MDTIVAICSQGNSGSFRACRGCGMGVEWTGTAQEGERPSSVASRDSGSFDRYVRVVSAQPRPGGN